jgi:hypothetical protein
MSRFERATCDGVLGYEGYKCTYKELKDSDRFRVNHGIKWNATSWGGTCLP